MRILPLLLVVLVACSDDPKSKVDAAVQVDSKLIDAPKPPPDAPPDAAPDATPMNITTACDHACTALAACFMEPPDPGCNMGCAQDLADCTAQQVAEVDACSTQMCGDITNNMSPLIDCITAVTCVDMITNLRK
jgi:hypothetical protein